MKKVSQISGKEIAEWLKLDDEWDTEKLEELRDTAISYVCTYTGQNREYLDSHAEINHAVLVLVQDMHDNRAYYIDNDKVNIVAQSIMDMHMKMML